MAKLVWDQTGHKYYETGVKKAVLYRLDAENAYSNGVAWNGITSISENPSGAEASPLYADDIKYLNLISNEEFGATIEAYTYPDEFMECDGTAVPVDGMYVGQQSRKMFGLSYVTTMGNDVDGNAYGYKIHLIYGCTAAPSDKAYSTINDSPDAITFSWEVNTTPVEFVGFKPVSTIVIDSTKFVSTEQKAALAALEEILYGTDASDGHEATVAQLPLPSVVKATLTVA